MQPNDKQSSSDGNEEPIKPTENTTPETAGTVIQPSNSAPSDLQSTGEQTPATESDASSATPTANEPANTDTTLQTPDQPAEQEQSAVPNESPAPVAAPATVATGSRLGKLRSNKKLSLLVGIIVIVVLLLAGSAGAYFGVIAPKQPQRIVQDSLKNTVNTEKISSGKFEGELTCVEGESCKSVSGVTFEGAFNDKKNLEAKIVLSTTVTKINLDLRSVGDKSIYMRLSGLDGLDKLLVGLVGNDSSASSAMVKQLAPIIAKINNQWYTIDENLLSQVGGMPVPSESNKISEEDAKKIGDIYKKHQFIKVDKKLPDQDIHGIASYHVQATIDKDQLKAFLTELKNANINNLKIDEKQIDQLTQADLSKYPFELWVSKSSRTITQIATTIKEDEQTFKIRVAMYDTNKPVNVEKPAGAKSVLELVSELAPLYSGGVQGADSDNPASLLGL